MKRLFVFAAMLATASSCFAYYGDYSSSSSSGWLIFIGILMITWGILEIILFFKIWEMTNDIKALKKDHFNETTLETNEDLAKYLRKNLVLGNMGNVKRLLLQDFIDHVEYAFGKFESYGYEKDDDGISRYVSFRDKNLKESIRPYVEYLQDHFDKIGEEMPSYIKNMNTFGDYFNLFKEEDFIVQVEKEDNKVE